MIRHARQEPSPAIAYLARARLLLDPGTEASARARRLVECAIDALMTPPRCEEPERLTWRASQPRGPNVTYSRRLTRREQEVLHLIAAGASNNVIARELVLSVRTVERHITNIYTKIGARSRADAVAYVFRQRLDAGSQRARYPA
jgi:DNA-binding NarL/FixJ family response regulator